MPKFLRVMAGPDKGKIFLLQQEINTLFGRSKHADSRLNDLHVSRVHCEVELLKSGRVLVMDLESSGTSVNGKRVAEQIIKPGDVIRIGETDLRLEDGPIDEVSLATLPPPVETPKTPPITGNRLQELTGRRLSHYEVGPMVARGNTGLVFKGHDFKNDRVVALKVLFPEFSQDEDEIRRFVRAVKTMLPLQHPNLVRLYGAGKTGPFCYVAMEFVEGESVAGVLTRLGTAGMLDWKKTIRLAYYLGRGLEYAHSQNVIHRNITPTNILVGKTPESTKLGDLMLAKAMEGKLAQQITKPGEMLGDVRFMAPERIMGGAAGTDGRADLYSLGALVYTLLTGRPPFQGDNLIETLTKIRQDTPVKPKKFQLAIPDQFEGIVLKLLSKKPEERYPTATALLKEFERIAPLKGVKL